MLKKVIIKTISLYQRYISPLLGQKCRFYPTCSEYGKVCFQKYPPHTALLKTLWRILRCNPFSDGGIDNP